MSNYGPRIEPGFFQQDAILKLQQTIEGRSAILLLLELRARCFETLSDGFVPAYGVRSATGHPDPDSALEMLIVVGALVPAENGKGEPGWQLDWSSQIDAATIAKQRADKAAWNRHQNKNHSTCAAYPNYNCHKNGDYKKWLADHPNHLGDLDGDRDGDQPGDPLGSSTRPDSTRPDSTRSERGREGEVVPKITSAPTSVGRSDRSLGLPPPSTPSSVAAVEEQETSAPPSAPPKSASATSVIDFSDDPELTDALNRLDALKE